MKKLIYLFLTVLITLSSNAQETLLNDYSTNEKGEVDISNKYEELFFSTYTDQTEGKAYDGIIIKNKKGYASSRLPKVKIPIKMVAEFQLFLKNGRDKYFEWKQTALDNDIVDMEKTIGVFKYKLDMSGDDYGYFSGKTDAELDFKLKDGTSQMNLKFYINNGVRSEIFILYLIKSNEDWRDLGFLRFIDDMTVEKVQVEIDKINKGADLFKN